MTKFFAMLALFVLCQCAAAYAGLKTLWVIFFDNEKRAWEMLKAYDRLANAALNGNGKETISSRAYRGTQEKNRRWCLFCRLLDKIEADHCLKSKDI